MQLKVRFTLLTILFALSFGLKAQSEKMDQATFLDFFLNGQMIEKGHYMLIYGNEEGEMSETVLPGIQNDPNESMIEFCKSFGYRNCRVEKEYETDENPSKELLKNLSDTKHYMVGKGEDKRFKVVEVASDSKGPDM